MKRWGVFRAYASGSRLVPTDTGWRYWTRRGAERMAFRGNTLGGPFPGAWYTAMPIGLSDEERYERAYGLTFRQEAPSEERP